MKGRKGRSFRSCHPDQSLSGNLLSWQTFFPPFAQKQWIIPDFSGFPEKRIAKDFVGYCRILTLF